MFSPLLASFLRCTASHMAVAMSSSTSGIISNSSSGPLFISLASLSSLVPSTSGRIVLALSNVDDTSRIVSKAGFLLIGPLSLLVSGSIGVLSSILEIIISLSNQRLKPAR